MQSPVKLWKKLLSFSKEHVQKYSIRSWPGAAALETWGPWGRCLAHGYGWEAMGTVWCSGAHRGPVVLQGSRCTESFLCVAVYKFWGGSELILAAQSIANGPRTGPKLHPWASQSVWLQVSRSPQTLPCRFVASFPVLSVSYTSVQLVFLQDFLLDWIPQCTYGWAKNKSFMATIAYRFTGNGNAYKGLMSSNLRLLNNVAEYIFALDKQHWSPQEFCL